MTPIQIAEAVLAHANKHWGKAGWDMIAECMGRFELAEEIEMRGFKTAAAAILHYKNVAALWAEREAEVRATIW